jgi:hypothetical protein
LLQDAQATSDALRTDLREAHREVEETKINAERCEALVLHQPDFAQPFHLKTDRFQKGIGTRAMGHYRWADDRDVYIILVQDSIPGRNENCHRQWANQKSYMT